SVRTGEAPAEDGEVLGEDEHLPALDRAVAGDDAVAEDLLRRHPEVVRPVRLELVELDEAAGVEQQLDPLPRGELSVLVLLVDPLLPAAQRALRVERGEPLARREPGDPLLPLRRRHPAAWLRLYRLFAHGARKLL